MEKRCRSRRSSSRRSSKTPTFLAYSEGDDQIGHGEGPTELAKLYPGNLVTKHKHSAEGHRPLPGDKGEVEALVAAVKAFIVAECPE